MTRIKVLLIVIAYATLCLGGSLGIANCSGKRVTRAKHEVEVLKTEISALDARIAGLEAKLDRSISALEYAFLGALQALEDDKERIAAIMADDSASDWLKCPLPECVSKAFAGGTSTERNTATEKSLKTLR